MQREVLPPRIKLHVKLERPYCCVESAGWVGSLLLHRALGAVLRHDSGLSVSHDHQRG